MTTYPTLPDLSAPPAVERSQPMLTEVTDDVRTIDVPLETLLDRDVIRRHPSSDEGVVWRPTDWRVGDGAYVTYTVSGSDEEHRHDFDEPHPWVTVQAPAPVVER
jgi:hypothetical protein